MLEILGNQQSALMGKSVGSCTGAKPPLDGSNSGGDFVKHSNRIAAVELAVMFVDINGYMRLCEDLDSIEVAILLRDYYSVVAGTIVSHGGTIQKFIGDGVLASFGAASHRPYPAADAISCGFGIGDVIRSWRLSRGRMGLPPVGASVGVAYGPVAIADLGNEATPEWAIVGDTVNVSSRLASLATQLEACIAVTDRCVEAARKSTGPRYRSLCKLAHSQNLSLRGRSRSVRVWWADA